MAALSKLTGLSDRTALLVFSFDSLAGSGPAGAPSVEWMDRRLLRSSELRLAAAIVPGRFRASIRLSAAGSVRQRSPPALAARFPAGRVRHHRAPLGSIRPARHRARAALERDFRRFAAATAIGLAVGILYAIPLATHFGDPLATVNSYHSPQWQGGWLFGFPFYAIVKGTLIYPAPWTNLVLSFGWIFLVVIAVVVMVKSTEFRAYCREHIGRSNIPCALSLVPVHVQLSGVGAQQLCALRDSDSSLRAACPLSLAAQRPASAMGPCGCKSCSGRELSPGRGERSADAP